MSTKDKLHHLVDELPETELHTAERFLEYLRDMGADPFLRALARAPEDDEQEAPEEQAAVLQAKEDIAARRVISHKEARQRLLGKP